MFWVDTKRIIKSGLANFWRSSVVSLSSVLIFTVTLFVIGSLIFLRATLDYSLTQIKDKVDVNVYFTTTATEDRILAIKSTLEKLPEVSSVQYTTREQALSNFKQRHENDYLTIQALDELDDNPLGASLNIRAKETSQYESIVKFLEDGSGLSGASASIIDKINYKQNKEVIDKLTQVIDGTKKLGLAITFALSLICLVITFNTIRLAIYIAREEIGIMQLVGAGRHYIRGPFIIEGVLYGAFSAVIAMIMFYPATLWLGSLTKNFFGGINVFDYYLSNFIEIFLVLLMTGAVLGAIASFLAVRKYLR